MQSKAKEDLSGEDRSVPDPGTGRRCSSSDPLDLCLSVLVLFLLLDLCLDLLLNSWGRLFLDPYCECEESYRDPGERVS